MHRHILAGLLRNDDPVVRRFGIDDGVTKSGSGAGTVTAGAIQCGAVCSDSYADGTSLTLSASPAPRSQFIGWLTPWRAPCRRYDLDAGADTDTDFGGCREMPARTRRSQSRYRRL